GTFCMSGAAALRTNEPATNALVLQDAGIISVFLLNHRKAEIGGTRIDSAPVSMMILSDSWCLLKRIYREERLSFEPLCESIKDYVA
ncbi:MAG: hypothetical protein KGI75_21005, partial [Rhizobiaceae bacterium]|nr:hypothetical protein [Rhizobiaceae bacterium]